MSANGLTLWGVGTARTMRAHWMLEELGLDYTLRPIQARTGETKTEDFLRLNPRHKIPVLEHGELVIAESAAIATYLIETFPAPDGFFVPRDAAERARLNEWTFFVMTELDAHALYIVRRHFELAHIYGEAPHAVASAKEYFCHQLDGMLQKFPADAETLLPEGMSVADILLVTCISYALALDIAIPQALVDYRKRLIARPAFERAFLSNFPDRTLADLA